MSTRPRLLESALRRQQGRALPPVPNFLVRVDPWPKVFLQNLLEFLRPISRPAKTRSGEFWADVFVGSGLPWWRFGQSILCHVVAFAAFWAFARFFPRQTQVDDAPAFAKADVIYYQPAEYLAPLNTSDTQVSLHGKGDPVYAAQPIISVPPGSDNRSQTIVTPAPPSLRLTHDASLPNIVAWSRPTPTVPIASTVASSRSQSLEVPVVAPAPELNTQLSRGAANVSQAVIAPAPEIRIAALREELTLPQATVAAPAPEVRNTEQLRRGVASADTLPAIVPPPPAAQISASGGRLIALGIHPVVANPVTEAPAGNRRGSFAATPDGKPAASGAPEVVGTKAKLPAEGGGGQADQRIPPGIFVGTPPSTAAQRSSVNPRLVADATAPRPSLPAQRPASEVAEERATDVEKEVFGERRFYSMTLNMPNLNSSSGSWIIHFAELGNANPAVELVAPAALQEVDPGYPLELMRHNVHGTVTLYAVIEADGSVGKVRVLNSADDRLDQYAASALSRWRFRPATKNGSAVALEAVVMIPFRPLRGKGGF